MDDLKAKQQVVEKIKSSANILVTVSDNPTVDALSAAIGLTLLFEKLGKYGTAIFSGVTPPAIGFLEPEKVLDDTTDSLRDFIIALDKEKADHLRYKVEGDAVKIFITPFKTTITSDDLQFSQGDYNVELVIALGVDDQDHLDKALEAHGQIFHDAAVITITANDQTSKLGGIDWHDSKASSLSEMVTGLAESLKTDKNKSLIDAQIATAFMTGLVAQTERFSNRYTSAQSLTVASALMASGADQQLIATKLQEAAQEEAKQEEIAEEAPVEETAAPVQKDEPEEDGTLRIIDHSSKKEEKQSEVELEEPSVAPAHDVNAFAVTHEGSKETLEDMDHRVKEVEQEEAAAAAYDALNHAQEQADPRDSIEEEIEQPSQPEFVPEPPKESLDDLIIDDAVAPAPRDPIAEDANDGVQLPPPVQSAAEAMIQPSMGGTLSATAEQAADDKRREEESDRNKTILSHGGDAQEAAAAASVPPMEQPPAPQPFIPPSPLDLGLPLPPPLPDFSMPAPAALPPSYAPEPTSQPEILGDILAPESQPNSAYYAPPAAQQDLAPAYLEQPLQAPIPAPQSTPPANNPGQFQIPGQQ